MNTLKKLQIETKKMKTIYNLRKQGKTDEWSPYTECKKCGKSWLWGVEDNLDFTCPDCEEPICPRCKNTGVVMIPNQQDDYDWEECGCGLKPLKGSEDRYLELTA